MELSVENAQFATASIQCFTKAVDEATAAVNRLIVALDEMDAKLHKLGEEPYRVNLQFDLKKGRKA